MFILFWISRSFPFLIDHRTKFIKIIKTSCTRKFNLLAINFGSLLNNVQKVCRKFGDETKVLPCFVPLFKANYMRK